MSEDPEITDPRDPHKVRDIEAELDRWLQSRASLREATVSHALLQAARDEILALRAQLARAQAYGEVLTKHVLALIETVEQRGAPNAATLIAACEGAVRKAFEAGDEAAARVRGRDD